MEAILISKTVFIQKNQLFIPNGAPSRYNTRTRRLLVVKSGQTELTHQLFDKMPSRDTLAWNSLITSNLSSGNLHHVVSIYQQMLTRGIRPDKHTLPRLLAASRRLKSLYFGKQLHAHAFKFGLASKEYVITALMELYNHLDCSSAVESLFDNPVARMSCVSWTLLIKMHMRDENPKLAVDVFYQMVGLGVTVDSLAAMAAISACTMLRSLREGRKIHDVIARVSGLDSDIPLSNSLLKMYLACGSVEDAREVFDKMADKDVISWTEMMSGYVKNGGFNEGLKLFKSILSEGIRLDNHAISSILPACARMTAHKQGRQIHGFLIRNNFDLNLTLRNALMDMYVKSGFLDYASNIFAQMAYKDSVSWTIMMHGYSLHGQGACGVELFRDIQDTCMTEFDQATYVSVIHACRSANMVEEGKYYFGFIKEPEDRHYALMVSLLERSGLFDEAGDFIKEKQIGNNTIEHPKKAYSWIEFRNKVHVFGTEDASHPKSDILYEELQRLRNRIEEMEGFIPREDLGFDEIGEERECPATRHSEMLAMSFGLISSRGATIRITKNVGVCMNCHEMAKAVSKLVKCEIIIRDPSCFHHFKGGSCSCGDLW